MKPASFQWLTPRLDFFFQSRGIAEWEFLSRIDFPTVKPTASHLVVAGDAFQLFTQPQHWKDSRSYYFWVLCSAARQFLVEGLGFPAEAVSVIPRHELATSTNPPYKFHEAKTLVYAGRTHPEKFVQLAENLANAVGLSFTAFLNGTPSDRGQDWFQQVPPQSALINLSHYRLEDFSVVSAQAQAHGIPVIAPYWFGFKDLTGPGVFFLEPHPELLDGSPSEAVLQVWLDQWRNRRSHSGSQATNHYGVMPRSIETQEIFKIINRINPDLRLSAYIFFSTFFKTGDIAGFSGVTRFLS